MRLSTLISKLENAAVIVTDKVRVKIIDTKCAIIDKADDLKIQVRALQLADLRRELKDMRPLDRQEIEIRCSEINALRDAAEIRKAERRLRHDIASKIKRGEISIETLVSQLSPIELRSPQEHH